MNTIYFAAVAFFSLILGASAPQSRTYYVSKTEKSTTSLVLGRLATPDAEIVVTEVPQNDSSIAVKVKTDEQLFLVEDAFHSEQLFGERARFGQIAVVVRSASARVKHLAEDPKLYALKIDGSSRLVREEYKAKKQGAQALAFDGDPNPIQISEDFLREKLEGLSGARPVEVDGRTVTIAERRQPANKALARAFLTAEVEAIGFVARDVPYASGVNFVAERAGTNPDEVVIVSAHLDSMGNAGADDDGSGVISALATLKSLHGKDLRRTLRFIAFDEEERGLVGSRAYVRGLSAAERNKIVGVVNIEMTGYDADNDGGFHVIDCNEGDSAAISQLFAEEISARGIALQKVDACTNRSDHASFWEHDIAAVVTSQNFFGGDSNPCYHLRCDTVDKINFSYMKKMTEAVAAVVGRMTL